MDSNGGQEGETAGPAQAPPQQAAQGQSPLAAHISSNKIDFALWCTRLITIVFTFNYLVPIFGSGTNMYYKALMANAATSALRLHQRLPRVQFTREFLAMLFVEDSAHYLLYSFNFIYSGPMTLVLLPIMLFAVLHICSYTVVLMDLAGIGHVVFLKKAIEVVEMQSVNILRTIAFSEIFIFPLSILMLFSGRASLMTVFVYYRFLTLRYASRRNPYSRNSFYELRMTTEHYAQRSPESIRNFLYKAIEFVNRLAPAVAPAPAPAQ